MVAADSTRTLVIIPTYNERENLQSIIGRTLAAAPDVHILVVDDGSPDGTGAVADELSRTDGRVHVMHRTEKNGLGAAYLAGFAWGRQRGYALLVELDADGSHPPERLPALIAAVDTDSSGTVAGSIGSRWVAGGSVVDWPWARRVISRGGSWYARTMLGLPVRDVTAGYRVYRADILDLIGLDEVESRGYCFQIDLTRRVFAAGYTLVEIPIEFREREIGESKMSGPIVLEAMTRVTQWGLARVFRR
ncbi:MULTISPECIES: polyprenol monophosphomannose synthase [unclassified Microbacterium]|uniref:polyprenol monophosphomannose synthase n=1 Tax=unclassified Microbacterium TaxID=2609290 RepID=UPI00214B31C2|nr:MULTISPECIES: polyprenol monophosphomannose synthase [unclassified Microbacterium]MCR2785218.1 polyprenol monophosphomannose synthase [Microbacterium sp. zg.B96]MDL5352580.1 polyprenol monophosphomannose synthase [Microbacterium sp. zg-YB36]WIM16750.1 polyprenol monophosphomannose synthase [Microbacterium sp. zg-B96]